MLWSDKKYSFLFIGFLFFAAGIGCSPEPTQGIYYLEDNLCNERYSKAEQSLLPIPFRGGQLCVYSDYHISSGIRTPLDLGDAFALVNRLGLRLPTPEVVDSIYAHADIKIAPIPMPPTSEMTTVAYYVRHDSLINAQLRGLGFDPGPSLREGLKAKIIAGHKKDVVYINPNSTKVAIYGWHQLNGKPIQTLYTGHVYWYVDYSQGVRLIYENVRVNGKWLHYSELFSNEKLKNLLCDEPTCGTGRYPVKSF